MADAVEAGDNWIEGFVPYRLYRVTNRLNAKLLGKLKSLRINPSQWRVLSVLKAYGTLNMGAFFPLLFVAAQHLPGGAAATLGAVQPIVVAALAVWILRERLSGWRVLWGLCGMGGIALVGLFLSVAGLVTLAGVLMGKLGGPADAV